MKRKSLSSIQTHDKIIRLVLDEPEIGRAVFEYAMPKNITAALNMTVFEPQPSDFISAMDVKEARTDKIYKTQTFDKLPVYILFEHKNEVQPYKLFLQLARYYFAIRNKVKQPNLLIFSVVVILGPKATPDLKSRWKEKIQPLLPVWAKRYQPQFNIGIVIPTDTAKWHRIAAKVSKPENKVVLYWWGIIQHWHQKPDITDEKLIQKLVQAIKYFVPITAMYQLLYTREIAGFFVYLGSRISKTTMAALEKALKGVQQQHLFISYADEIKAEGIAQGKAEIVRHMYSTGLKADDIAALTGLSIDAVSAIIEAPKEKNNITT
jgi:hypothetical protein